MAAGSPKINERGHDAEDDREDALHLALTRAEQADDAEHDAQDGEGRDERRRRPG